MKPTISFSILCIFIVLTGSKCQKDPMADNSYGLPNATQTGANNFACRVNDSNWISKDYVFSLTTSYHGSNDRDTFWILGPGFGNKTFDYISLRIKSKIQEGGTYRLNNASKNFAETFKTRATCGPTVGYGGSQSNFSIDGHVTITKLSGSYNIPSCCTFGTYDANAIMSGTFDFIIAIPNCDTIKVTDGRFDVNYSVY